MLWPLFQELCPTEDIMKRLTTITFAFLIFITSTHSALPPSIPSAKSTSPEPPTIVAVPAWSYRGCYTDHVDSRTLTGKTWMGLVTPGRCAHFCVGYRYFALEGGNECYCGNAVVPDSLSRPDKFCANVCDGEPQSACGGDNAVSLYEAGNFDSTTSPTTLLISSNSTANSPKPVPPIVVEVEGWTYLGCYTDDPKRRTLISKLTKGDITPQNCAVICQGYRFFGLEYSNECWCGNSLTYGARRVRENVCSHICMGNFGSICGGRNALSLYKVDEQHVTVS